MGIQFSARNKAGQRVQMPERFEFYGFNVGNAAAVMGLLGFQGSEQYGEASIRQLRDALAQARAHFQARAPKYTRQAQVIIGSTVVDARAQELTATMCDLLGGEPARIRGTIGGLDEQGLFERLNTLSAFVEAAVEAGATSIRWG